MTIRNYLGISPEYFGERKVSEAIVMETHPVLSMSAFMEGGVAAAAKGVAACPYCAMYGADTHSFHEIARTSKFGRIMYTCAANAKDYSNSKAISTHISTYLDVEKSVPWTWVFDCRGLKTKHTLQFDLAVTLGRLIQDKYAENLQMIYILYPTVGLDALVTYIIPFLKGSSLQYLRKLKGSPIEMYMELKKDAMEDAGIQAILQRLQPN